MASDAQSRPDSTPPSPNLGSPQGSPRPTATPPPVHPDAPLWSCSLPVVILPYATLDVCVNDRNLWGNAQHLDPALIEYDFENEEHWKPFMAADFPETEAYPIRPFYEKTITQRVYIPTPISSARLEILEGSIYDELHASFLNYRHTELLKTGWFTDLDVTLRNGLIMMEFQDLTGLRNDAGVAAWQADVVRQVPLGFRFRGQPFNFCFTDPRRIRHEIMEKFDYHKCPSTQARFSFGTYACGQYGGVVSVWVYVGLVTPAKEDQSSGNGVISRSAPKANTGMPILKRDW
jgi:hypothetical protein